jgi:hypothetical protein
MGVRSVALLACVLAVGCIDERGADNLWADAGPAGTPDAAPARGPRIAVTPEALEFGSVPAGESASLSVTVSNIGDADLAIWGLVVNGSAVFSVIVRGVDPQRRPDALDDPDGDGAPGLAPGASFALTVRYAPRTAGADVGALAIRSSDPGRPEVGVRLAANTGVPCLALEPEALSFPGSILGRPDDREVRLANCGDGPLTVEGLDLDGDVGFSLPEAPPLPLTIEAGAATALSVRFTAREVGEHRGTLTVRTAEAGARTLPLLGRGAENRCPIAVPAQPDFEVQPLDVVMLDGSPSRDPDGRVVRFEWVVVSAPEGSGSVPGERMLAESDPAVGVVDDDRETPQATFWVDLPGTYVLELRVRDAQDLGPEGCPSAVARVGIVAAFAEAVRVELTWRSPGDPDPADAAGADLDLHLLHAWAEGWFTAPYDCHFHNPTPDWGLLDNPDDDPALLLDDDHRGGPEVVALRNPENTTALGAPYIAGVHYYRSADRRTGFDFGPVVATLRVFVDGELAWDYTDAGQPGERAMEAEDHFWDAVDIEWPSGEVRTRDRYYTQRP